MALALMFYHGRSVVLAGEPREIVNSVGDRVITKSWFDELKNFLQEKWALANLVTTYCLAPRGCAARAA